MLKSLSVYDIAAVAGTVILATVIVTLILDVEIGPWQAVLLIFSGVLFAAPVISKFTLNKDGFVFETRAAAALDKNTQAIQTINEKLSELSTIVENIQLNAQHKAAENGKTEDVTMNVVIPDMDLKLATIKGALAANSTLIEESAVETREIKGLLGKYNPASRI